MANNSYSINDSSKSDVALKQIYAMVKALHAARSFHELDYIFDVAIDNSSFPNINIPGKKSEQIYIEKWVNGYCNAMDNLPSQRTATPKSSCSDPAIKLLVQITQGSSDESASSEESFHNLYMSAENIQGNLLEEYIAKKVRPYGFLWCAGNVLRAIDFCNTDGSTLLQIKNKNNTENSSSSNIREGTTIEKWYRLGSRTQNGQLFPKFRWDDLNAIINENKTEGFDLPPCNMSEEDYQSFIRQVATSNPNIISDL